MKSFKKSMFVFVMSLFCGTQVFAHSNPALNLLQNIGVSRDQGESLEGILTKNQDSLASITREDWEQAFVELGVQPELFQSLWNNLDETASYASLPELAQVLQQGLNQMSSSGLTWSGSSHRDEAVIAGLALIGAGAVMSSIASLNHSGTWVTVGTSVSATGVLFIAILMFYGIP